MENYIDDDFNLEKLYNQKLEELNAATDEEQHIMEEIDKVFESTPDRVEAEKIVTKKWAPLMDAAIDKSRIAFDAWTETNQNMRNFESKLSE
jgi:hypothetical protein